VRILLSLGVLDDLVWPEGTPWARDRDGRPYDGLSDAEAIQGALPRDRSALMAEERETIARRAREAFEAAYSTVVEALRFYAGDDDATAGRHRAAAASSVGNDGGQRARAALAMLLSIHDR